MSTFHLLVAGAVGAAAATFGPPATAGSAAHIQHVVDPVAHRLMDEHDIPGMAVAVTAKGKRHVFHYGVASRETGREVDGNTLFEIGSISKTFTATLGAYAAETGAVALTDSASQHLPALAGSEFDKITLLQLATYTAGGLPLQFPDEVTDEDVIGYFRTWQPAFPAGSHRQYSNPSIGLFGDLVAKAMGGSFEELMERELLPALGLTHTHIRIPDERLPDYALGTAKDGRPARVSPGVFDAEAYGVKTTASDLIRFVEANLVQLELDQTLQRAIAATHVGHHSVGAMTQALGWETYEYPATLERLLSGNAAEMALEAHAVEPTSSQGSVLINKTGSTNGFGAYVAFIPEEELGVVMLANRNYPIPARVRAAHEILSALAATGD